MTSLLAGDSLGRARVERSDTPIVPARPALRPLARGSGGLAVRELQKKLVTLRYLNAQDAAAGAGVFGPRTEAAVKAFQDDNGLRATGQVGQYTHDALEKALARPRHLGALPKPESFQPGEVTAPQSAMQLEAALEHFAPADPFAGLEVAEITAPMPNNAEVLAIPPSVAPTVLNLKSIVPERPTVIERPALKPTHTATADEAAAPETEARPWHEAPPRLPIELPAQPGLETSARSALEALRPARAETTAPRTQAARYAESINLLQVVSNPRYAQAPINGLRFVQDVAAAMNAEIPATYKGHPLTAKGLPDWMHVAGPEMGWVRADAKQAQRHANTGRPTIAVLGSEGLLAVVRPGELTAAGPTVAHAGIRNFNHGHAARAFGTGEPEYFIHP